MAGEYETGYRRPPKATQFKPGQSGNPKGRPKGSANLASDLAAELKEQAGVEDALGNCIEQRTRALEDGRLATRHEQQVANLRAFHPA